MPKFQIELDDATYETLAALAIEELRQVPQQAAWVLMQTLRASQGLSCKPPSSPPPLFEVPMP